MHDEELLDLLEALDPARSEEPPAPGSSRYNAIKEQAMSTNTTLAPAPAPASASATDPTSTSTGWRLPRRRLMAAAAVAAVALGVGVLRPGHEPSAEAAIRAAAHELSEVTSLRADMHFDNAFFGEGDVTASIAGDDFDTLWEWNDDDGPVEQERIVTVDDVEYRIDRNGQATKQPVDSIMDDVGGSFAQSSAAIVTAVLDDADVDEVGTDEIRGVDATHYRLEFEDATESALAALPDQQLEWFALVIGDDDGGLDEDVTVDIWVADGLVRRFDVSSPDYGTQSVELYDFGAPITVTPPPGPYTTP